MRSSTPKDLKGFCTTCLFREKWCLCPHIHPIETRANFLIIRHRKEATKTSNSARIAHLALPNSTLIDYGLPNQPFDPACIDPKGTRVLFPSSSEATDLSETEQEEIKNVIVLDGTWSQARRMYQRIEILRTLPKLILRPQTTETDRIRRPPNESAMATIEAMARAIEILGEPEKATALDDVFCSMYQHFQAQRRCIWPVPDYGFEW